MRVLAVAALLGASLAAAPAAPAEARPPARLLVEAREFNLALSRPALRAGPAIIQLANRGEDPHDLRLSGRAGTVPETLPGEVAEWSGTLRRGRYTLSCTVPRHRTAGMRATLRVR